MNGGRPLFATARDHLGVDWDVAWVDTIEQLLQGLHKLSLTVATLLKKETYTCKILTMEQISIANS